MEVSPSVVPRRRSTSIPGRGEDEATACCERDDGGQGLDFPAVHPIPASRKRQTGMPKERRGEVALAVIVDAGTIG
jgi:hypothetical protein